MEQCPVCGRTYGVTHTCPGPPASQPVPDARWAVPAGFAPFHYMRQALAIARLDDGAVLAASRDKTAMVYGGVIWVLGQILIFAGSVLAAGRSLAGLNWVALLLTVQFLLVLDAVLMLTQYGICHLLARWWFGAGGTYRGVLRPLLLGSIVTWLGVVPFVGIIVAGLWSIAVMMIVFEDVDRIGRMKAFGLSLVIGLFFQALVRALFAAH
jgi:hypothetical protein